MGASALAMDPLKAINNVKYDDLLKFEQPGDATLLFTTDMHAHMKPLHFMEPLNLVAPRELQGLPGYLTGPDFLDFYGIKPGHVDAYFGSCTAFSALASKFGKMGGGAHMATIIKSIVQQRGKDKVLVLDGGDTWATTALALFTKGQAIVDWMNYVGYDVMVGHWDFTVGKEQFLKLTKSLKAQFISQNVVDSQFEELVFKPYTIRDVGGAKLGIIGNSFPYTPVANPREFTEGWSFGIRNEQMQDYVKELREKHKVDAVILLSHDGLPLDIALAKKVKGIDVIISGHTHDVTPQPFRVGNTLVCIAGSHGKFIGRLDLSFKSKSISSAKFKLIPVLSNIVPADKGAQDLIDKAYAPYKDDLETVIGTSESLIYKRDTFYSTFDRLAGDAIMDHYHGIDIVFSPGYRWGNTLIPGQKITKDHIFDFTAITYPYVNVFKMTGKQLLPILEDIADNVFNKDPFYQQGGDMSRVTGVDYNIRINAPINKRMSRVKVGGKLMDPNKEYVMAAYGGNLHRAGTPVPDAKPAKVYDIIIDYVKKKQNIKIDIEPNVRVLDAPYRINC